MASSKVEYLINHVILPPQLPQQEDSESGVDLLLKICYECAGEVQRHSTGEGRSIWSTVQESIRKWQYLYNNETLCESAICEAIVQTKSQGLQPPTSVIRSGLTQPDRNAPDLPQSPECIHHLTQE